MNLNQPQQQKKVASKVSKLSSNSSNNDVFRKSKIKQSEFVIAEVCCSRHLHCMKNGDHSINHSDDENNSFSLNSELLVQCSPMELSAEPLIQYQTKPEVDMLAQINIKKKAYENLLKKCEQEVKKEEVKNKLKKLSIQAKNVIQKNQKKAVFSPKSKWGHSLFEEDKKNKVNQEQKQEKDDKKPRKQIKMKPIDERIKEYKQQQMKKDLIERQKQQRRIKQVNVKQLQQKIKDNANKILEDMRFQKIKKDEQKKIIEAKIRALQLKSQEKVKHSKKKIFQGGEQFNLGDSQYSTFSARANNRKMQKKKKKEKPKQPPKDDLLKTNKHNFLRKSSQSIKKPNLQNIKTQQIKPQVKQQQQPLKQQIKGPFFIWNIPVYPNQLQKIEQNKNQAFLNIERFNHKSGKTFREEANQYLTKKMENKMVAEKEKIKQQQFMNQVEVKKQNLLKTFQMQQNLRLIDENFWNEDQVFKPNILQNFHFYAK